MSVQDKMFQLPEHNHNLSLRLSEVLDDIGVNKKMVKKWRRTSLLEETLHSLTYRLPCYVFGSQSEGTTTIGLESDEDLLTCHPNYYVIQGYAEWKPGLTNLLMIQDDITSPGYCHLQLIRPDTPLPVTNILGKHCMQDAHGRILLKNTAFDDLDLGGSRNGPARTLELQPGVNPTDRVIALSCKSWPYEARGWSQRSLGKWPTEDMKKYVGNSGCFVVPVGSKVSQVETLEWRISTSMAERCLMYNLNITQIRCFVLLKMILKTYLQHPVSSYMCKTILLRCIEKMHYKMWQENNLLACLTVCLQALHSSIFHENCPHYFIPGNNLMAGRFSPRMKEKLLKSLHHILESQGAVLYGIQIDDLGDRLGIKMNPLYQSVQSANLPLAGNICLSISTGLTGNFAHALNASLCELLIQVNHLMRPITVSAKLERAISICLKLYKNGNDIERKVVQLRVPFLCSCLGSLLASVNMGTNQAVSPEALNWLSAGLNSDVTSGRLKLASVLYCAGDMLGAESILMETERLYRLDSVEPICRCYAFPISHDRIEFCRICYIHNEKAINSVCAYCIKFSPAERYCIPREFQFEMFRSTEEERLHRVEDDRWMDMAVVDSLPFLYFLQYKVYCNLQSFNNQQRALEHLALTVTKNECFGHRETALNLLGQCMEQENRLNDALARYITSLKIRGTNNVARIHILKLLWGEMQNNLQKSSAAN